MKRRILLPLVLLAGLSLAGCKWFQKEESSSKYKVEITNKTELQADWYAGTGSSRGLSLTLTPEGNPVAEMANGNLVVTSSNPSVANITGLNINALQAGDTKVTVKYHGAKDSVDLTILPEQTIPVKYGVTHYGTAEDPLTNEEALIVAKHANYAGEDLYVGGTIASFYHAPGARDDKKVSWFLEPAQPGGEKFEIYLCLKADNTPLTDDDVWVGGYAVAHGPFTKYNSQYETSYAVFDRCEGEKPQPRTTISATFAQALEVGAALADGADSYDYYQFDAYVTAKEGSNYFLTATQGEELVSATSDEAHGSRSYYSNAIEIYQQSFPDALTAKLKKDAKITVTMVLKNYHGQIENLFALTADDVVVVTEGGEWSYEQLTVTQALAKIAAIDISGVTQDKTTLYAEDGKNYQVTGIVVRKGNTWTDQSQYKNADFYIADEAGDTTNALQVFRYADKTIFDALVVDQTQVKVTCQLAAYVRVNDGVPSVGAKETNQNPTTEILGQIVPELTGIAIAPETASVDIAGGAATKQFTVSPVPSTAQMEQANVRWSISPENEHITINNGLVTVSDDAIDEDETATFTVTAAYNFVGDDLTASATLTVTNSTGGGGGQTGGDGTEANPYNTEEAVAYLSELEDNAVTQAEIYVQGTISSAEYSSRYGNWTIWLKNNDGSVAQYFELYATELASPVVADDMGAGVSIKAHGYGQKYVKDGNTTYELTQYKADGTNYTRPQVYEITDRPELTGIKFDKESASIKVGETLSLTIKPIPTGALLPSGTVEWVSSDSTNAPVTDGVVSGVGAVETAIITATLGGFTAQCNVTVKPAGTVEEHTLTLVPDNFSGSSYANVNGDHTIDGIVINSNQVMKQGTEIQFQKNNGYIYNKTDLGTIKSITVNTTAGSFTVYYGTTEHPTSGTTVGNGFFTVQVGGATGKASSIVIVYENQFPDYLILGVLRDSFYYAFNFYIMFTLEDYSYESIDVICGWV